MLYPPPGGVWATADSGSSAATTALARSAKRPVGFARSPIRHLHAGARYAANEIYHASVVNPAHSRRVPQSRTSALRPRCLPRTESRRARRWETRRVGNSWLRGENEKGEG